MGRPSAGCSVRRFRVGATRNISARITIRCSSSADGGPICGFSVSGRSNPYSTGPFRIFVERLIRTLRREYLDPVLFWNALDLERKLNTFKTCLQWTPRSRFPGQENSRASEW